MPRDSQEKESLIVQEVFHKITSDVWGTNRIANWLNARGIPTKHGDSFWRGTSVRAVIRNPIYTGRIRFGDDLSEPFEHLRLIDDVLFEQCDRLVREKAPRMSGKRTSALRSTGRGLLTGILYCGSCGERMCFNHNRTTSINFERSLNNVGSLSFAHVNFSAKGISLSGSSHVE